MVTVDRVTEREVAEDVARRYPRGVKDLPFDSLVSEIQSTVSPVVGGSEIIGIGVDSLLAGLLGPIIEAGEAHWEPTQRRVTISPFGILLLSAEGAGSMQQQVHRARRVPDAR